MSGYSQFVDAALGPASQSDQDEYRPVLFTLTPPQLSDFKETCQLAHIACLDTMTQQLREWICCRADSVAHLNEETVAAEIAAELVSCAGAPATYGVWCYYPWRRTVVHLLPEPAYRTVRSNRSRDKITRAEAAILRRARVGVVGLSVGHAVALVLAQEGLCGQLRLADFDTLELSNLNRLRTSVVNIGVAKSTIAAREIAELDPYLGIEVFAAGVEEGNVDAFLAGDGGLDVVVEECDSLHIKLLVRERARAHGIPVVMDTNDRGLLDVERFDREPTRPLLHGLLGDLDHASARALDSEQRRALFAQFFGGREHMSARFRASLDLLGSELLGASQLASDVHLGAALVANVVRRIVLGQLTGSGRYTIDLEQLISD